MWDAYVDPALERVLLVDVAVLPPVTSRHRRTPPSRSQSSRHAHTPSTWQPFHESVDAVLFDWPALRSAEAVGVVEPEMRLVGADGVRPTASICNGWPQVARHTVHPDLLLSLSGRPLCLSSGLTYQNYLRIYRRSCKSWGSAAPTFRSLCSTRAGRPMPDRLMAPPMTNLTMLSDNEGCSNLFCESDE